MKTSVAIKSLTSSARAARYGGIRKRAAAAPAAATADAAAAAACDI